MENAYWDVGLFYADWSDSHIEHDKRLCSCFKGCSLPLHKCLLSIMGLILRLTICTSHKKRHWKIGRVCFLLGGSRLYGWRWYLRCAEVTPRKLY